MNMLVTHHMDGVEQLEQGYVGNYDGTPVAVVTLCLKEAFALGGRSFVRFYEPDEVAGIVLQTNDETALQIAKDRASKRKLALSTMDMHTYDEFLEECNELGSIGVTLKCHGRFALLAFEILSSL